MEESRKITIMKGMVLKTAKEQIANLSFIKFNVHNYEIAPPFHG